MMRFGLRSSTLEKVRIEAAEEIEAGNCAEAVTLQHGRAGCGVCLHEAWDIADHAVERVADLAADCAVVAPCRSRERLGQAGAYQHETPQPLDFIEQVRALLLCR